MTEYRASRESPQQTRDKGKGKGYLPRVLPVE